MFLRLPVGSARRFAALLLLLGVMLGGAVDAIACEPSNEITAIAAESVEQGSPEQVPDDERHGDCVHGHCHHGAQSVQAQAFHTGMLPSRTEHHPMVEQRLASTTTDSLKRPPRA